MSDNNNLGSLRDALADGADRFALIADAMPQLVWSARADGTIEYYNQRWIAYTGLGVETTNEECSAAKGAVHPDDLTPMWDRWSEALASGTPYEAEYRLRGASDGTYRWFLARAMPVRDEHGIIVRWIGTCTDIDDERRARDNLAFVLEASNAFNASLDVEVIARELAALSIRQFADWCLVVLLRDGERAELAAIAHQDPSSVREVERFYKNCEPLRGGALDETLRSGRPLLLAHATGDQLRTLVRDAEELQLFASIAVHSAMLLPLSADDGRAYGAAIMISAESFRVFSQADLDVAMRVAASAANAMHNAAIFRQEHRASQRLRFIAKAGDALFESFDLSKTFQALVELVISEMADFAVVLLTDSEGCLRPAAMAHRNPERAKTLERLRGRPLTPQAEQRELRRLRERRPRFIRNFDIDAALRQFWPYLAGDVAPLQPGSSITIPLYSRGATYGGLYVFYDRSARTYDEQDIPLFAEIGRRASIAIENAQSFERERRIAETFQLASLPASLARPVGLHLDVTFLPGSDEGALGGDWYDSVLLPNGSLLVSVGDVMGRGLGAAAIMSQICQIIAVVAMYEREPSRIFDAADHLVRQRFPEVVITAFVGIIAPDRTTMQYASAGHRFPLLRRDGEIVELRSTGLPLGLRDIARASSQQVDLRGAELLVLYTNGLVEDRNGSDAGERRLSAAVASDAVLHAHAPARFIRDACVLEEHGDDVAILTVRFVNADGWSFNAENAQAATGARTGFVKYLRDHADDDTAIEAAELVFGELIGNVVRHAPGPIDLRLDWSLERPVLHVIDRGPPFSNPAELPIDPLSEGGRGLFIAQELSERVSIEHVGGYGNHVAVELRLDRPTWRGGIRRSANDR